MAISFDRKYAVPIGLGIVVVIILVLVMSKNKKSKKKSPKASPVVSPTAQPSVPSSPSLVNIDPILIANNDGTYAIVDSVESFSRNRPRYGRRPRRDFLSRPGHGKKPDRDPVYGTPGFEEDSDVEIMPITRPKPGRDPVYGIPIDREKPGYGIGRPGWGRRERFGGNENDSPSVGNGMYIPKNENVLEFVRKFYEGDQPNCGPNMNQCRLVNRDNRDDMFWYLSKVYRDIKTISLDRFNEIVNLVEPLQDTVEVVNRDPLTVKVLRPDTEAQTFVVGENINLFETYTGLLITAKKTGRPLPRPVDTEDYSS